MNISGSGDGDSEARVAPAAAPTAGRGYFRTALLALVGIGICLAIVTWLLREPAQRGYAGALIASRSGDPSARLKAIDEVTQLGVADSGRSIPPVIEALGDPDGSVRAKAAESLGILGSYAVWARMSGTAAKAGDEGLIDAVTKGLLGSLANDQQPLVRAAAAAGLCNISATSPAPARSRQGSKKGEGAKGSAAPASSPSPVDYKAVATALIEALSDKNDVVRTSAVTALGAAGPKVSGDPPQTLVAALKDQSAATRAAAAKALSNFPHGLDPVIPILIGMSATDGLTVHDACVEALRQIKQSAISAAAVPALVEGLGSRDREIRIHAVSLLTRLGAEAKEAVPALIATVNEPIESDRSKVGGFGGAVAMVFAGPAHDAARALGKIAPGTPLAGKAIAALSQVVRAGPRQRRASAADALSEFGATAASAIPDLIKMLEEAAADQSSTAKRDEDASAQALAEIAADGPSTDAVVSALRASLRSDSRKSRAAVVGVLEELGPKAAIAAPEIQALEKDDDPNVRKAASKALEAFGRK